MYRRRQFTAEFKARVVLEVLTGQKTAAQVCREQQLKPDLLSRWKADFVRQAPLLFHGDERMRQTEQRIAELERMVGRLTVELEVAKKAALLSTGTRNGRQLWS
jgi:transposase